MEKLPGEAKDIAYHQNCNKYEYYFSGDRQLFEVLYNLNLHQYLNMTILILLLPGGGELKLLSSFDTPSSIRGNNKQAS